MRQFHGKEAKLFILAPDKDKERYQELTQDKDHVGITNAETHKFLFPKCDIVLQHVITLFSA